MLSAAGATTFLLGNGGGYYRGGVAQTGTISGFEPTGTSDIRIVDELLDVRLGKDAARVQVRYILKNTSDRKVKVRFGFPVEEKATVDTYEAPDTPKPAPKPPPEHLGDYRVEFAGRPVKAKFERELDAEKNDERMAGLSGWMISEVVFSPGEETTMKISYVAPYPFDDVFVSDDSSEGDRTFKYRLSTGAVWQGPIGHGKVVVIPEGIDPNEITIRKPVNRFHRVEDRWEWDFENLEPTLADDIVVEAIPAVSGFWSAQVTENVGKGESDRTRVSERAGKWFAHHLNYSARASSTLPPEGDHSYGAGNLKDADSASVWSEGAPGNGVGEWIELKPDVVRPLNALEIAAGHQGVSSLFTANARPKTIEVTLNGLHSFEAKLEDTSEPQRIFVRDFDKPVKTIRLTVKEVYPGSRFEDLCIGTVWLETRLKKKPHVQPAR